MFSLRLPVPFENTPKTTTSITNPAFSSNYNSNCHYYYSYSHSQTHRYFPQSMKTSITKRGIAPPNVALREEAEAEPIPPELTTELMPKHVAVIMDGNGRWAKMRGLPASAGHVAGVESLRRIVRLCNSWGIKVLTVFAFSTDNWVRPKVTHSLCHSLISLVS